MGRGMNRRDRRAFTKELLRLHNAARNKHGLKSLKLSKALGISAMAKSRDMVKYGYFSHDSPRSTWHKFLYKYAGSRWRTIGENIAKGQDTARQVFEDWMGSPLHRRNILSKKYKLVGFGFASKGHTEFWTTHLGTAG